MGRWLSIGGLLFGILIILESLRLLLHHQYAFLHHIWRAEPKEPISTFAFLLAGIWMFLVGLFGLIGKKQRNRADSE